MEWLVNVIVEADDVDAVHELVSSWTLTPGATVLSINTALPVPALAAPVAVDETGTVGEMEKPGPPPSVIGPIPPTAVPRPPIPPEPEPEPEPTGPQAMFTATPNPAKLPGGVMAKVSVSFDASESAGDSLWFVWDYGDGTTDDLSGSPLVSHEYNNRGVYTVTLTVNEPPSELDLPAPTDSTTVIVEVQ